MMYSNLQAQRLLDCERLKIAEQSREKRKASLMLENQLRESRKKQQEEEEAQRAAREKERQEAFERAKEKRLEDIRLAQSKDANKEVGSGGASDKKTMEEVVEEARLKKLSKEEKRRLKEEEKEKFLERKVALEMKRLHDKRMKALKDKRDKEMAEKMAKAKEEAAAMGVLEPKKKPQFAVAAANILAESKRSESETGQGEARDVPPDSASVVVEDKDDVPDKLPPASEEAQPPLAKEPEPLAPAKRDDPDNTAKEKNSGYKDITGAAQSKQSAERPAEMEKTESQKSLEYRKTQERIQAYENGSLKNDKKKPAGAITENEADGKPKENKKNCIIL